MVRCIIGIALVLTVLWLGGLFFDFYELLLLFYPSLAMCTMGIVVLGIIAKRGQFGN